MDREAQAPLVRNHEGDGRLEDGGQEGVDPKDQSAELFRERRRDLETEGEQGGDQPRCEGQGAPARVQGTYPGDSHVV